MIGIANDTLVNQIAVKAFLIGIVNGFTKIGILVMINGCNL